VQRASINWRRSTTPLSLAFVSLVVAIGLWIAVTEAENPSQVDVFPGAIEIVPVNIPEGQAVASMSTSSVRLQVRADEDTFRRLSVSDFRAEVNLAHARTSPFEATVNARATGEDDVDILEISPSTVTVTLEQSITRQVPVQPHLVGSPAQGFNVPAGGIESDPATVRVSGASSLIQLVASATADINLTGLRASLQQKYTLVPRDSRGVDLRGLSVEPPNADISVSIVQVEVTLGLTIVPQYQGTPADGYNLVSASVDPPAIPVTGPLELLHSVPFVTTEPVDVTGLRADATRNIRLRIPSGLQATRDTVTVRLRVQPAVGEFAIAVAPQATSVGEGLRASIQTSTIVVRVSGELPTLRNLQAGSLRATVSAAGLAEGVHVLQPAVSVPDSVRLVSTEPSQVVLVLSR
jgi:YbbR domain-containing protein